MGYLYKTEKYRDLENKNNYKFDNLFKKLIASNEADKLLKRRKNNFFVLKPNKLRVIIKEILVNISNKENIDFRSK